MKLGVGLPAAGAWATPENQIRVAQRAEALGAHSAWVFQRLLWGSLAEIREDIERYAEAGLTELFLEPKFKPGGAHLDRVLDVMAQLAPKRSIAPHDLE